MLVEIGLQRESLVASGTFKVFICGMGLHVSPEVRPVRKRLAAVCAPVRFLARVGSKVALQQPRSRELLPADSTTVRKFVSEDVHSQSRHTDIGFAARYAFFCRLGIQTPVRLLMPG